MPEFPPVKITHTEDDGTEGFSLDLEDPFAEHPPHAEQFYSDVGLIILKWSYVETMLETILSETARLSAANPYEGPRLKSFKKKIEAIKASLKGVYIGSTPMPSPFTKHTLSSAKLLSGHRKALAHFMLIEFSRNEQKKPVMVLGDREEALRTYTIDDLRVIRGQLSLLFVQLTFFLGVIQAQAWIESGKPQAPIDAEVGHSPQNGR